MDRQIVELRADGDRGGLLHTSVDKGIKKGLIIERSGPWVISAALGGGSTKG